MNLLCRLTLVWLTLASTAFATHLGSRGIDDTLTFEVQTFDATTGSPADADAVPTYRVYEDETGTPILTGSMALLDASNTDGWYSEQITLSAANGLESGKSYTIRISAAVGGQSGVTERTFTIGAQVRMAVGGLAATGFASGAIDATAIAADAIGASEIATGAIDSTALAANSINATAIATDSITAAKIAADSITSSEIADSSIDAGALAADAITNAKIAADAIGASELAADSITSSEVATGAIDTTALAASSITAASIASGAITSAKFDGTTAFAQSGDAFARIGATGSGLTSLASQASVNTVDDFLDTEIAALIAVKPDNKPTVDSGGVIQADLRKVDGLATIDSLSPSEVLASVLAVSVGKISGSATNAPVIRSADDTVNRVSAETNQYGDRTSIVLNLDDID